MLGREIKFDTSIFGVATKLREKSVWFDITVHNNTKWELEWTGDTTNDFSVSTAMKYWGTSVPKNVISGGIRGFQACENDNHPVKWGGGVTSYKINTPFGSHEFTIGFYRKFLTKSLFVSTRFLTDKQRVWDDLKAYYEGPRAERVTLPDGSVLRVATIAGDKTKVYVSHFDPAEELMHAKEYCQRYPEIMDGSFRIGGNYGEDGPYLYYNAAGFQRGQTWVTPSNYDAELSELYWSCYPDVAKSSDYGRNGRAGKWGAYSHYQQHAGERRWSDLTTWKELAIAYWKRNPDVSRHKETYGQESPNGVYGPYKHYLEYGKSEYERKVNLNRYWGFHPPS